MEQALYVLPAVIIGFTLHEYAHAWMAVRLGDPTPRWEGRLTLNPLKHLDPLGTLLVFIAFVGWAKPVRWNPRNLRVPIRWGVLLVAAAGPVMNLLLAIAGALLLRGVMGGVHSPVLHRVLYVFVSFNVLLFVFNLIPLPPLDGFAVLSSLAPPSWHELIGLLQRYGTLVLLLLLFLPGSFLGPLLHAIMGGILRVLL
ncbi:MAG: site-2 protease family protein [Chloroflexi bacterium]|nr:site-2 protease family protein [Chloroflexota bacterium]